MHGNLSPQVNRAPGHTNTREDRFVQSHHPIQDDWARRYAEEHGLPYNSRDAPALLLRSGARAGGWDVDPRTEFRIAYRELLDAGVPERTARRAIGRAYVYFDNLGWFD